MSLAQIIGELSRYLLGWRGYFGSIVGCKELLARMAVA
jgi:hypothetical protein